MLALVCLLAAVAVVVAGRGHVYKRSEVAEKAEDFAHVVATAASRAPEKAKDLAKALKKHFKKFADECDEAEYDIGASAMEILSGKGNCDMRIEVAYKDAVYALKAAYDAYKGDSSSDDDDDDDDSSSSDSSSSDDVYATTAATTTTTMTTTQAPVTTEATLPMVAAPSSGEDDMTSMVAPSPSGVEPPAVQCVTLPSNGPTLQYIRDPLTDTLQFVAIGVTSGWLSVGFSRSPLCAGLPECFGNADFVVLHEFNGDARVDVFESTPETGGLPTFVMDSAFLAGSDVETAPGAAGVPAMSFNVRVADLAADDTQTVLFAWGPDAVAEFDFATATTATIDVDWTVPNAC